MMSLGLGSKRRQIIMKNTMDYPNSVSQKPLHRNLQTKIVTLYGGDTWKEIRDLEKIRVKIQRKEADL